jgi:hypothetical protein
MTTGRINQVTILPGGKGSGEFIPASPSAPECSLHLRGRGLRRKLTRGRRGSGARPRGCLPRGGGRPSRELTRWRRNAGTGPRCGHLPVTFLKFPFTGVRRGRARGQRSPRPSRSMAGSGGACAPAVTSRGTDTAGRLAPSALGGVLTSGHQSTKPNRAR